MPTKRERADESWNPITGCTKVDAGCKNCYAERMSKRLRGRCGYPADDPFRVTLHPDRLDKPLHWKKPRRVFVNSMSDLFHEEVDHHFVDGVWDIMTQAPQHQFMILTKRPKRMLGHKGWDAIDSGGWVLPNVWLGVSVHDQASADERIPILLQTPAAHRFVSFEPALGAVQFEGDWHGYLTGWETVVESVADGAGGHYPEPAQSQTEKLDLIICGGESGPGARPMHPDWARSTRDQCAAAGVPFMFKQWGEWALDGWVHSGTKFDKHHAVFNGRNELVKDRSELTSSNNIEMIRVGKKAAGRLLDGRVHDG